MAVVKISKNHGANPTLGVCFWCGNETGEIALLGMLKDDQQAPMKSVISYVPCECCKSQMDKGVTVMKCSSHPVIPGQAPMKNGAYPTGAFVTLKEGVYFLNELANDLGREPFKAGEVFCLEDIAWDKLGFGKIKDKSTEEEVNE